MRRLAVQSFSLQKIKRPSLKYCTINSKKDRIACLGQSVIRRKLLISQFLISYTAFIITYHGLVVEPLLYVRDTRVEFIVMYFPCTTITLEIERGPD